MAERVSNLYDYGGGPRVDHVGHIYYNREILRNRYEISTLPSDRRLDVVISGGSMGGLFTAHALLQAGHSVSVFERTADEDMRGRGAGIVPDPELFAYMERVGLADRAETAVIIDGLDYLDHDGSVRARRDYTIWSTAWDTFYRPLREAIGDERYHGGCEVEDVSIDDGTVTASIGTGESARGDLFVAAEGYNSRTRRQVSPETALEYAGYVAWRGIVSQRDLPDDLSRYLGSTFVIYHGFDFQILTYPVPGADYSMAPGDRRVNLVWYQTVDGGEALDELLLDVTERQRSGSLPPGMLRPSIRNRQLDIARATCPKPLVRFIECIPDLSIQCIYDLKIPQMVFDRIVILGDAAFFVRPHMAAGTSKAAADGFTLAESISREPTLETALDKWEHGQLELGNRLVDLARERGDRYMHQNVAG